MATYRQIVYMALDELKLYSGDADYTPEHLLFLASKLRSYLLERKYLAQRGLEMAEKNKQEICLDLENTSVVQGIPCTGQVLKSTVKVPDYLGFFSPRIYPTSALLAAPYSLVPIERLPFTGNNRWTSGLIYVAKGPDSYLYLKSENPQLHHLKKLRMSAVFQDPEEAEKLCCDNCQTDGACDIMDKEFPLEDGLVTLLIQSIVQELSGHRYMPKDTQNNDADDMAGAASASPRNINR